MDDAGRKRFMMASRYFDKTTERLAKDEEKIKESKRKLRFDCF